MGVCPVGLEDGDLKLTEAVSSPIEGPATTVFNTELHLDVLSPMLATNNNLFLNIIFVCYIVDTVHY